MSASRFLVLDTETTGLDVHEGHRIIEVGCVEVNNFQITEREFHAYVNPEREIDPEAQKVHGLSLARLSNEPVFTEIASDFLEFVRDNEVVIHNASFDIPFLNNELKLSGYEERVDQVCKVVDSLEIAGRKHARQYNNLDALCKRYNVDTTTREEAHGALVDARLLARVYIKMTAGEVGLFSDSESQSQRKEHALDPAAYKRMRPILVRATDEEIEAHEAYIRDLQPRLQESEGP
ncbi:MAG: DNA polymerase III subunit epsilon [Gammaproteobacteria bacterium]|nr:DNA polymerase III subunit epsilon [Gammaproteobacteria bacterium]MYD79995.1 DNA polymerase III subunit epsilon [Gammaproteobacteria bacterium]